jgi:hypothetical protein
MRISGLEIYSYDLLKKWCVKHVVVRILLRRCVHLQRTLEVSTRRFSI